MKRKLLLLLVSLNVLLTSCVNTRNYITQVREKEPVVNANTKSVIITGLDNIRLNNFVKTFQKNYPTNEEFIKAYLEAFLKTSKTTNTFSKVTIEDADKWKTLDFRYDGDDAPVSDVLFTDCKADYVVLFTDFEITNRVELNATGGFGPGGFGTGMQHTSTEYCIVNTKVIVYDVKSKKQISEFISIGEGSVFLFNFTTTFLKAMTRSAEHAVEYFKTGKKTFKLTN